MFRDRVLVSVVLVPVAFGVIFAGGIPFLIGTMFLFGIAGWEYTKLFQAGGFKPAGFLIVGGVLAMLIGRYVGASQDTPFANDGVVLTGFLFILLARYVFAYETGSLRAGTDMMISIGGVLYIGLLGSYLVLLRTLPDGVWWMMVTLPAVWLADSGAYLVGRQIGRHRFSPRLSPKKTWEGYLGGIFAGAIGNYLLCLGWQALAGSIDPTPLQSGIIGLAIAVLTPLGDLGESMLKRQVGVKDSGKLLPGHGGALDRVDTWLWGGVIGYYLIIWFF